MAKGRRTLHRLPRRLCSTALRWRAMRARPRCFRGRTYSTAKGDFGPRLRSRQSVGEPTPAMALPLAGQCVPLIEGRRARPRHGDAHIVRCIGIAALIAMNAGCALHDAIVPTRMPSPAKSATVNVPAPNAAQVRMRDRENELLGAPLSQDSAAEIAFLHHPTVARGLAILGINETMRLNVAHGQSRTRAREAVDVESRIERALTVNVLSWLGEALRPLDPMPAAVHARTRAAEEVGVALFAARRAWIFAVAANQEAALVDRMVAALQASHDLAQRMQQIGNASNLEALRAERSLAEAAGRHIGARAHAAIERERLAHALGLWGQDIERMQLPSRLPDLPASVVGAEGLEARAVAARWDLRRLRAAIDAENATGVAAPRGLPLMHEDTAVHGPLLAQLDELAVRARAEVRAAWIGYRAGYDLARHARESLLPVIKRISEETLLRYNGMLVSVFALLADTAEQANAVMQALHAERDFWLAEVDLQQALAGIGIVHPGVPGRMRDSPIDSHHATH